jgi:hypothetical protein
MQWDLNYMEWWKFEKLKCNQWKKVKPRQKVRDVTIWLNIVILTFRDSLNRLWIMVIFDERENVWLWHFLCVSRETKVWKIMITFMIFLTSLYLTKFSLCNGPGQKKVKPKIGISLNSKFNWKRQRRLEKV